MIAGILLTLKGYNSKDRFIFMLGLFLATAKIQEVWLLLLVVAIFTLRSWSVQLWIRPIFILSIITGISILLWGQAWFEMMWNIPSKHTAVNMSLGAMLERLGFPSTIITLIWLTIISITLYIGLSDYPSLSREKAGFLICGSLLLAPYAAANSYMTILVLSVIPLFQISLYLGLVLITIINMPYILSTYLDHPVWLYSEYWTFVTLLLMDYIFISPKAA